MLRKVTLVISVKRLNLWRAWGGCVPNICRFR